MSHERKEVRLRRRVEVLAGEIGERHVFRSGSLERAAEWIEGEWRQQGYEVAWLPYESRGRPVFNLEVRVGGGGKGGGGEGGDRGEGAVVIGAHYDTVQGSPGADDNASAVATLLELSDAFAGAAPGRPLRFVAFVNEEPPFMLEGSRVYAKECKRRGDELTGMVSLEMLGYYNERKGSQRYPPLLSWLYPERANFVAFVANLRSLGWFRRCLGAFRAASDFPSEGAVLPSLVPGVAWSDHASFQRRGYPALMVTDTAFYRNRHYHRASDTPERLDYGSLARVTRGLEGMLRRLARE